MPEKIPQKIDYSEEEKKIFSEIENLIKKGAEFSGHKFKDGQYHIVLKLDNQTYEYKLKRPLPFIVDAKNKGIKI